MFMNITTHPYHLTQFKLCRVRNSARSVESYCTFVTDHIRTLKILFYNLGAAGTPLESFRYENENGYEYKFTYKFTSARTLRMRSSP